MQGDLPAYTAASPAEVEGVGGCVEIVTLVEQCNPASGINKTPITVHEYPVLVIRTGSDHAPLQDQ